MSTTTAFLGIVSQVLTSPTFQIESPRALAVLSCARYLQLMSCESQLSVLGSFCDKLYASLEKICTDVQASRFSYSTQRIKIMTTFHKKRATDLLIVWKELWSELSKISQQTGADKLPTLEPIFVQHCCSAVLESVVKKVFPLEPESQAERQLSEDQQCALRYVAGYILRSVKDKIKSKRVRVQHKDEALATLDDLSKEDSSSSEEETFLMYSRRWIDLVNRGGLYVVSDEDYMAFQSMELALQEYLNRGALGKYKKEDAIQYIIDDGDVQFFLCCAMSTVSDDCIQELTKLIVELLVTIRGFSLAAAYMEEYKMSKENNTKGKKSLRKELKRSEANVDTREAEPNDD